MATFQSFFVVYQLVFALKNISYIKSNLWKKLESQIINTSTHFILVQYLSKIMVLRNFILSLKSCLFLLKGLIFIHMVTCKIKRHVQEDEARSKGNKNRFFFFFYLTNSLSLSLERVVYHSVALLFESLLSLFNQNYDVPVNSLLYRCENKVCKLY